MNVASLIKVKPNPKIPDIEPGDVVKVSAKIVEGGKERIQVFQGVVIRLRRGGAGTSITVRHVSHGIGVERIFPLYSPRVEKVELVRHGKVRRAKLYYLRRLSGKAARIKERRVDREKKRVKGQLQEEIQEQVQEEAEGQLQEEIQEQVQEEAEDQLQEEIQEQVQEEAEEKNPD